MTDSTDSSDTPSWPWPNLAGASATSPSVPTPQAVDAAAAMRVDPAGLRRAATQMRAIGDELAGSTPAKRLTAREAGDRAVAEALNACLDDRTQLRKMIVHGIHSQAADLDAAATDAETAETNAATQFGAAGSH